MPRSSAQVGGSRDRAVPIESSSALVSRTSFSRSTTGRRSAERCWRASADGQASGHPTSDPPPRSRSPRSRCRPRRTAASRCGCGCIRAVSSTFPYAPSSASRSWATPGPTGARPGRHASCRGLQAPVPTIQANRLTHHLTSGSSGGGRASVPRIRSEAAGSGPPKRLVTARSHGIRSSHGIREEELPPPPPRVPVPASPV